MNDEEFMERFNELHNHILERFHKKIDFAKVDTQSPAGLRDERYWQGWNDALDWSHRIVRGDKSAD
jgi:hypothetical protein